jgi:transcriptional regulator with XRE-family HTH domain
MNFRPLYPKLGNTCRRKDIAMNIDYKLIGKNIRSYRKKKGITQEQLAELTELSTNHISHVEIGSTPISLPALITICEVLGITADQVLYGNLSQLNVNVINAQINDVFCDASVFEQTVMLSVSTSLKDTLRRNKFEQK